MLGLGLACAACEREPAGPPPVPAVVITVTPNRLTLPIGSSAALSAVVSDAEGQPLAGRTIRWATSAPEVAEVSPAGLVRALQTGVASISAHSEPGIGFARVVVQEDFRLPLPGRRDWLLLTEVGTPAVECPEGEGGLRQTGGRDCTHAGVSRYSLDFAAVVQEQGVATPVEPVDVRAAANGEVFDVCLQPLPGITCGPAGPFVAIRHAAGFLTIYAHLDPNSVRVRRKTAIGRGEVLGNMGASNPGAEAWLHFELRFEDRGADAAAELEELLVDGRKLREYQVGLEEPRYYHSTNGREAPPPEED